MTPDTEGALPEGILSEDGFTVLRGLLSAPVVDSLRDALAEAFPEAGPDGPYGLLRHNLRVLVPAFARCLDDPEWIRRVGTAAGCDRLVLFQDHLIWKIPGTDAPVLWHQDYAYWPLAAPGGWTLWIALDDADVENGCLHYVPGSQAWGERAPTDFVPDSGNAVASDLPEIDHARAGEHAMAVPVAAGDAILHHPLVWHMSPPNRSGRQRRAWSISWIEPGTRWAPGHAAHVFNYSLNPEAGSLVAGDGFPEFSGLV